LLDHRGQHGLGAQVGALEIDVLNAIPFFLGDQMNRPAPRHPSRRHEHVDAPELLDRFTHERRLGFGIANIAQTKQRARCRLLDVTPAVGLLKVITHDRGIFLGVAPGDRQTDSRSRTGDQCDFSFETSHCAAPSLRWVEWWNSAQPRLRRGHPPMVTSPAA